MSDFFRVFPKVDYDISKSGNTKEVTNIMVRYRLVQLLKERSQLFYVYNIKDGDRPDTIAYKYYGDSKYAHIVLLANQIHDPFYQWPLTSYDFQQYIKKKYGSLAAAQSEVKEYRKIVREGQYTTSGEWLPERKLVVDETTYNSLASSDRELIYAYDWEDEQNEARRTIKILDRKYLNKIVDDIEDIFDV